jgi:hypothetical protein
MPGGTQTSPSAADPLTLTVIRTTAIGSGQITQERYEGPVADLEAKEAALIAGSGLSKLSQLVLTHSEGRGALQASYERLASGIGPEDESIQELYGIDIIRDIFTAPYWKAQGLTNADIMKVRNLWERQIPEADPMYDQLTSGWPPACYTLYGHLVNGQDSYIDTMYELRETYRVTSARSLRKASSDPNKVVTLPALGQTLRSLIDSLPAGEWLKKPTVVLSVGRNFWDVKTVYHLMPKWSVIYGGTFTGVNA